MLVYIQHFETWIKQCTTPVLYLHHPVSYMTVCSLTWHLELINCPGPEAVLTICLGLHGSTLLKWSWNPLEIIININIWWGLTHCIQLCEHVMHFGRMVFSLRAAVKNNKCLDINLNYFKLDVLLKHICKLHLTINQINQCSDNIIWINMIFFPISTSVTAISVCKSALEELFTICISS